MTKDVKHLYATLLRYGLIEIRSMGDDKLHRARDLANILHNVPTLLVCENVDWDSEKKKILSKAKACNLDSYIIGLIAHIENQATANDAS